MTMHELNNYTIFLDWFFGVTESILARTSPMDAWQFGQAISPFNILSIIVTAIFIIQGLGALLLAVFLFLMLLESKAAGLFGQIASLIAFLTSLTFIVAITIITSQLSGTMNFMGGGMGGFGTNPGITMTPSIFTWVTLAASAICFLMITIGKRAFK